MTKHEVKKTIKILPANMDLIIDYQEEKLKLGTKLFLTTIINESINKHLKRELKKLKKAGKNV